MTLDKRAQKVRRDLFDRYDQLNALWLKAEEQLKQNHIPRMSYYDFPESPADLDSNGNRWTQSIALWKVKGEWRICYGTHPDFDPGMLEWKPIVECSAEVRVEAVKHLRGLQKAAIDSAETFIPEVDSAIKQLSEAIGGPDTLAQLMRERANLNGKAK
jgi:hypothetical protein